MVDIFINDDYPSVAGEHVHGVFILMAFNPNPSGTSPATKGFLLLWEGAYVGHDKNVASTSSKLREEGWKV